MARNTSDSIEEYIKELLGQSGIAEIQRSNLAYFSSCTESD